MPAHPCSECGGPVEGRAKTCGATCRMRRHRRLLNERPTGRTAQHPVIEDADQRELIEQVFKAELTPYVREAITEDVVKGLSAMAKMTEDLVASIAADLNSTDPVARGRAQTLMAKYLFGQVVADDSKGASLTVNMPGMATPGDPGGAVSVETVEALELRTCEHCHEDKDIGQFEPGAPRCNDCQAELREQIERRYA